MFPRCSPTRLVKASLLAPAVQWRASRPTAARHIEVSAAVPWGVWASQGCRRRDKTGSIMRKPQDRRREERRPAQSLPVAKAAARVSLSQGMERRGKPPYAVWVQLKIDIIIIDIIITDIIIIDIIIIDIIIMNTFLQGTYVLETALLCSAKCECWFCLLHAPKVYMYASTRG